MKKETKITYPKIDLLLIFQEDFYTKSPGFVEAHHQLLFQQFYWIATKTNIIGYIKLQI